MVNGAPSVAGAPAKKKRARKPAKKAGAAGATDAPTTADSKDSAPAASLSSTSALVEEVLRQTGALKISRVTVEETVSQMFEDGLQYDSVDAVVALLKERAGVKKPQEPAKAAPQVCVCRWFFFRPVFCFVAQRALG